MFNKESWDVIDYYQQQQGYHKAHGNVKSARFYEIANELARKEFSIQAGAKGSSKISVKEIKEAVRYYEQQLCFEKARERDSIISKFYEIAIELSQKVIPQQIKLAI